MGRRWEARSRGSRCPLLHYNPAAQPRLYRRRVRPLSLPRRVSAHPGPPQCLIPGRSGATGVAHGKRPGPLPPPLPLPSLPVCRQNLSYSPVSGAEAVGRWVKWLAFTVSQESQCFPSGVSSHSFIHSIILLVTEEGQPHAGHWPQRRTSQALPPGRGHQCPEGGRPERTPNPTSWGGNLEGSLEEVIDTMAKSPRITGRWAGRAGRGH